MIELLVGWETPEELEAWARYHLNTSRRKKRSFIRLVELTDLDRENRDKRGVVTKRIIASNANDTARGVENVAMKCFVVMI